MKLFTKSFFDLTLIDIRELVTNQINETRNLEFKLELNHKERKEFLADITAFANTDGGIIFYGIEEDKDEKNKNTGRAGVLKGIKLETNQEILIRSLEQIIRDGTDPMLTEIQCRIFNIGETDILAIGIKKSFGKIHMVTYDGMNKFFKRSNTGKFQMDYNEIRSSFTDFSKLKHNILEFRDNRIKQIKNPQLISLTGQIFKGNTFLHCIPMESFKQNVIDFTKIKIISEEILTTGLKTSWGIISMYNYEGYLVKNNPEYGNDSYNQFFRDGSIEYCSNFIHQTPNRKEINLLDLDSMENWIVNCLFNSFEYYRKYNITSPFFILISVCETSTVHLYRDVNYKTSSMSLERNEYKLPEIILDSMHNKLEIYNLVQPVLDILYQSVNIKNNPFYSKKITQYSQNNHDFDLK